MVDHLPFLSLFLLYINMKIDKIRMLNVRLAGDHLYWKWLFTWLSLVMSLMASFCAVLFFPRDVLDDILDLTESVSGGFPTYPFV